MVKEFFEYRKNQHGNIFVLFKIKTPKGFVYMKHNLSLIHKGYLVCIDTKKFIKIWRKSKNDERFSNYHLGNKKIWMADKKYHFAENAFSHGIDNPVPIAREIKYTKNLFNKNIYFGDEFTRTIWLLSNEAEYFPIVASSIIQAKNFQKDMSFSKNSIYSLDDLYDQVIQCIQRGSHIADMNE